MLEVGRGIIDYSMKSVPGLDRTAVRIIIIKKTKVYKRQEFSSVAISYKKCTILPHQIVFTAIDRHLIAKEALHQSALR